MNGRNEEELIRCAFGELSPEEQARVREHAVRDPRGKKVLDDYELMRQGLRQLRDIPEMQMSTERLRDALLRDGLKPQPAKPAWWSWLAWPVALGAIAALGFIVVTRLNVPTLPATERPSALVMAEKPPEVLTQMDPAFNFELRETMEVFGQVDPQIEKPARPVESAALTSERRTPRVGRRSESSRSSRRAATSVTQAPPKGSSEPVYAKAEAPEIQVVADAAPASMGTLEAPVVVIEAVPTQSGASRAVEVEAASNVLIGG